MTWLSQTLNFIHKITLALFSSNKATRQVNAPTERNEERIILRISRSRHVDPTDSFRIETHLRPYLINQNNRTSSNNAMNATTNTIFTPDQRQQYINGQLVAQARLLNFLFARPKQKLNLCSNAPKRQQP